LGFFQFLKPKKAEKGEKEDMNLPELPSIKDYSAAKLPVFSDSEQFEEGSDLPPLEPLSPFELEEPKTDIVETVQPQTSITRPEINQVFETDAIKEEPEEDEEPMHGFESQIMKGPVFVKAYELRAILEGINKTATACRESKRIFTRIQETEKERNEAVAKWHAALEDIQRRLVFIDKLLFE